jgi:hypothetical protein
MGQPACARERVSISIRSIERTERRPGQARRIERPRGQPAEA